MLLNHHTLERVLCFLIHILQDLTITFYDFQNSFQVNLNSHISLKLNFIFQRKAFREIQE